MRCLCTGAGGFIASHLCRRLRADGHWVRGVDIKYPEWSEPNVDEFVLADLREAENARRAMAGGIDWVFALAANMGGIGYISDPESQAGIIVDNTLINVNTIKAAADAGVQRYFFSSSACTYPDYLQQEAAVVSLKESDVYPAACQDAYGWEKLHGEHLCRYVQECGWLETRVARFHNIYGTAGEWCGGREKLPAAACRKVAIAKLSGDSRVEIWGDGKQTRSFCYVDDCLEMVLRLMESAYAKPMNIGTDCLVSADDVFALVAEIAGIEIEMVHVAGPQGVRGRNADLALMREELGYEPRISLEDGLRLTYEWVETQVIQEGK